MTFVYGSAAAADAPPIDLANPTATVNDPAAGLTPVDTSCGPGQVDLNTASSDAISSVLGIPSDPTVTRIIALRPWLKGTDLSSVPGIGPSMIARIAPKTCATQPPADTPQPRACTSSSQVDLNTAPAGAIQSKLGLPANTVQALIAARPLPQNLSQIVPPRVPGFPQPTIDRLTQQGRVCVTPSPYLGGDTSDASAAEPATYRWATPAGGAVVRNGGYGLVVPPGRVTDPAGAYASVTPLPAYDDVLPSVNGHIWGNWNSGSSTVAVQLPWSSDDPNAQPLLIHEAATGIAISRGAGVALGQVDGQPVMTGLQTSLSTSLGMQTDCSPDPSVIGSYPGSVFCLHDLIDGNLAQQWRDQTLNSAYGARASLNEKPSCGNVGTAVTLGQLPFGVVCVNNGPDSSGTASWDMTNVAQHSVLGGLASLEILFSYSIHPDGSYKPHVSGNGEDDFALHLLEAGLSNKGVLFGSQNLNVSKALNSPETSVDMGAAPGLTGAWAGMAEIINSARYIFKNWDAVDPVGAEKALSACAHLDSDGLGCLRDATSRAVDAFLSKKSFLSKFALSFYTGAAFLFKALDVGEWITNFGAAIVDSAGPGEGVLLRNYAAPPPPGGGGGGGGTGGQAPPYGNPGGDGSYIVRDPNSHRSVLVKGDQILDIKDGGTFLCLAATRFVWDNASLDALNKKYTGTATCRSSGADPWVYSPAASGFNVPDNVILRESADDVPAGGTNQTFLVNNTGQTQEIRDGGAYLCLAYANPVIWNVPLADLPVSPSSGWSVDPTAASCG